MPLLGNVIFVVGAVGIGLIAWKVLPKLFSRETMRFYDATTPINVSYGWKNYLKPEEKTVKYYNNTEQTFSNGELEDIYFK